MTRNLKRLVAAGFVAATSGNGRAVRHALTDLGAERLALTMPVWEAEHARLEGAIGADVWARTREGLRTIRRTLKAREA
jgi:DNA-binding PadR family transcriptional regulator